MDNKNNEYQQNNMSPVAAGITGFILGVMGTAAVVLSDKKTRTKVTQKATDMKDTLEKWSKDTLHDLKTTGEDIKKEATQSTEEMTADAEDMLTEEGKKEKVL